MPEPKDEETAKVKIILPILAALGWDALGDEVVYEYTVGGTGSGSKGVLRVDIALAPDPDRPVMLVEAKAPGRDLRRFERQVLEQAFLTTADICVLTDASRWWFYLPRAEQLTFKERRFTELHLLDDPIEDLADDLKAFLGRMALVNGDAATRARQVLEARKQADLLTEQLGDILQDLIGQADGVEPHPDLVQLLRRLVYKRTGFRPTPEQVAAALPGQCAEAPPCRVESSGDESDGNGEPSSPTPNRTPPTPPAPQDSAAAKLSPPSHLLEEGEILVPSSEPLPGKKPIAFILWGKRHSTKYCYNVPLGVAQCLWDRYPNDFLDKMGQVPRSLGAPGRAKRPWHKGVRGVLWYVCANWNCDRLPDHARRFLSAFKDFGHHPNELWLVYKATETTPTPAETAVPRSEDEPPERRKKRQRAPKPDKFMLWGETHQAKHWYQVLVMVAEAVYNRHQDDFDRIGELGPRYASRSPRGKRRHKRVDSSGWHVDVNFDAPSIVAQAKAILRHFDETDDLQVYGPDGALLP